MSLVLPDKLIDGFDPRFLRVTAQLVDRLNADKVEVVMREDRLSIGASRGASGEVSVYPILSGVSVRSAGLRSKFFPFKDKEDISLQGLLTEIKSRLTENPGPEYIHSKASKGAIALAKKIKTEYLPGLVKISPYSSERVLLSVSPMSLTEAEAVRLLANLARAGILGVK